MKTKLFTELDLMLFADGGGEGGGDAGTGAPEGGSTPAKASKNPLADVQYGTGGQQQSETIVKSDTQVDRAAAFDGLIKGEYKAEFDARVQKILSNRFRDVNALKEKAAQLDSYAPMMDALASKYGVSGSDPQAILKAIEEDNSFYEDEAMERGLTVEQLKHMKRIERENADFRRAMEEQQRMNAQREVFSRWDSESAECTQIYPNFNFDTEAQNPETGRRFMELLGAGISVKDAYELIHKDDIIGGAMQYTAEQVHKKTVNDIRARGMRPAENGTSGSAPAQIVKTDPAKLTRKDREEISRRVLRGDRTITFD
jgi:hypothetical protein